MTISDAPKGDSITGRGEATSESNESKLDLLLFNGYRGRLAVGPRRPDGGLLAPILSRDELSRSLEIEQQARIPDLFDHFNINPVAPNAWETLALALAAKHVPGFKWSWLPAVGPLLPPLRAKRGRGRPKKIRLGGLLDGWPKESQSGSRSGRPPKRSLEQKRSIVEEIDAKKRQRSLTDQQYAEEELRTQHPGIAQWRVTISAKEIVRKIRRLRNDVRSFDNSTKNT